MKKIHIFLLAFLVLFIVAYNSEKKRINNLKKEKATMPGKTTAYPKDLEVKSLLIKNINIIDVRNNEVIENRDVFIKDGIIEKIGSITDKNTSKVIDGKGLYLMPSLIDTHVHVHFKETFLMFLLHGVTTVRDMTETVNEPKLITFREKIDKKEILSSDFLFSSRIMDGRPKQYPELHQVTDPKEGRKLVKFYAEKNYDYIKVYHSLSKSVLEAIIDESNKYNLKVIGHKSIHIPLDEQIKMGQNSFEHLNDFISVEDLDKVPYYTNLLNEYNSYFSPTLSVLICSKFEEITKEKYLKYMPHRMKELYKQFDYFLEYHNEETYAQAKTNDILKALYENETPVLIGTDSGMPFVVPGYSLIEELKLMKDGGYDIKTLINMVTLGNAKGLSLDDRGVIEEGYKAHLLLLSANPYEDLDNLNKQNYIIKDNIVLGSKDVEELWKSIEYNK